jgi:GNAT superfamily N-acetyltransferase
VPERIDELPARGTASGADPRVAVQTGLWSDVLTNFSAVEVAGLFLRNAVRLDDFYQLCAGLQSLPARPPRKIGGSPIEPIRSEEVAGLRARLAELPATDRKELLARIHFFQRGFRNGYTLRDNGVIAYLQWIAYPSENDVITGAYGRRFAPLSPREVLIENAFTFPAFRGRGFLGFGTWELLTRARDQGYARAVTFVHRNSLEALNTFMAVGFRVQRPLREVSVCGWPWRFWGEEWKRRARLAVGQQMEQPCRN